MYVLIYIDEILGLFNNISKLKKLLKYHIKETGNDTSDYTIKVIYDTNCIINPNNVEEYTIESDIKILNQDGEVADDDDDYSSDDDDYEV